MATTRNDLLRYLTHLLGPDLFEDYAPNGLQVEGKSSIQKLAFAVSATQESIRATIDWGGDALIVHHGIFWKYQGSRPVTGAWGERVKLCVKNDLNLFAYHLPLDAHDEVGNAISLAREIGLSELSPFALYKKRHLGQKGKFVSPICARDLKDRLEKVLHHPVILASHDEGQGISSVGIITGGANNDWIRAMEEGLDAYITGEISEYNWHDAIEAKIHYFAGGHHATERFGTLALMKRIHHEIPKLECRFFDSLNPA